MMTLLATEEMEVEASVAVVGGADAVEEESKPGRLVNSDSTGDGEMVDQEMLEVAPNDDALTHGEKPNAAADSVRSSDGVDVPKPMTLAEKEAQLNAYLEEQAKQAEIDCQGLETVDKPPPKRKSLAERLKALPANILKKTPAIRPSTKAVIDFDEDFKETTTTKKKGIEDLMSRFMVHTTVKKPPKREHYKVHITKKIEDSQGLVQEKTEEAEYIKVVGDEDEEDAVSPLDLGPGVKLAQMKAKLMSEIRNKRAQACQEKLKVHAMYSEEKDLDGKDEEEEILLDEDITDESEAEDENDEEENVTEGHDNDSESFDEDADEDIETLLDSNPKRKKLKKRLVYLEEEADESGEEGSADEDEENILRPTRDDINFIDDRPISDDEDDSEDEKFKKVEKSKENLNITQNFSVPPSSLELDAFKSVNSEEFESQDLFSDFASQKLESVSQGKNPIQSFLDPNKTPNISAAIMNHRASPIGPWNSIASNQNTYNVHHPGSLISPLIPRLTSESALDAFCEDLEASRKSPTPVISAEVARLIGKPQSTPGSTYDQDELEGICSAKFPSQQPETPQESQTCDDFLFDSQDDQPESLKKSIKSDMMSTKLANLNETPKTGEQNKITRHTRLDFQNYDSEGFSVNNSTVEGDGDDEEEDELPVGSKVQRKRKRRLQFSDDESDNEDDNGPVAASDKDEDDSGPVAASDKDEDGSGPVATSDKDGSNSDLTDTDDMASEDADSEKLIDSDSEKEYDENEEEIKKPKKFLPIKSNKTGKIRKDFVDAEAELSGSEIGSADEDEHGMDEYEDEGADEEVIDEDKLRDQVGRAHLKQLLDDDQREIRYLQDVYLEDGDLHMDGKGRERKFKWKNLDDFTFDAANMEDGGIEITEDELEIKYRQERVEKLKWLRENSQNMDDDGGFQETSQKLLEESQFLKAGKATLKKLEKRKSMVEISAITAVATVDKSPSTTLERKGSFLQRENTLSRLAEMSRIHEATNAKSGKGFVFQMVTPPTDSEKSKKASKTKRASTKNQPNKIMKIDRSFSESESQNSIFKFF